MISFQILSIVEFRARFSESFGIDIDEFSFYQIVNKNLKIKTFVIVAFEGVVPLTALTFQGKRFGVFWVYGAPLIGSFTPRCQVFWSSESISVEYESSLLNQLKRYLEKNFCVFLNVINRADCIESYDTNKDDFLISRGTYFVDLKRTKECIWSSFEGRARTAVRKAEKNNVFVRSISKGASNDIDMAISLIQESFLARGSKTKHPIQFYEDLLKGLVDQSVPGLLLSAEIRGEQIAVAAFLKFDSDLVYVAGGATSQAKKLGAPSLLIWKGIALADSCHRLDLGGVGIESIDKFKASFGGEICERYVKLSGWLPVSWASRGFGWLLKNLN